jgi:ComF family protein
VQGFFKNATRRRLSTCVRSAVSGLGTIVYPRLCENCGVPVERGCPLCYSCARAIEPADRGELDSILARLEAPVLASLTALWYFEKGATVRHLQHQLKYGNRPIVGKWFGRMLGSHWLQSGSDVPDVVLPIPLHPTRFLERGYNQSLMIAEGFSEILSCAVDDSSLLRARSTRSQTRLSRSARQANVQGAFVVAQAIEAAHVVIVDDVLTTGATLNEAARAVLERGASRVSAAAIGLSHS